jgi:putative ABC transport system permease protein
MTTAALMRLEPEKAAAEKRAGKQTSPKAGEKKEETTREEEDSAVIELPIEEFPGIRATSDFFAAYQLTAAKGFLFTQEDLDAGNPVIVLGSELAETLFPDGGALGARVSIWYQTYTVVGILEPTPLADPRDLMPYNRMAFFPQEALEKVWNKRVPITSMRFAAEDSSKTRAAANQLKAYFASAHPDIHVMITDPVEELRKERQTLSRVIAVLVFLSAVGLLIAAINLLNLMLIRIIKHTRGIGIMRALGSTRRDILRLFMSESLLMCVAGALIGTAVSPLVYRLLQTAIISGDGFASQSFGLDLVAGAAVGLLFSLAFGLYPAVLAKNTDAALAIRAE